MGTDIKKMYLDLHELLEEICEFLSTEKLGKISPRDKKKADELIKRSKKQLVDIARLQNNEEYVTMDKKVIEEEDGKCDIYSSADDFSPKSEVVSTIEEDFPYTNFSAKNASVGIKYGYISMKRKFVLTFEAMREIFASIFKEWLLIYWNERDQKPLCTFNLRHYHAKESDGDKNYFELISYISDNKVYKFMAQTRKDMLQWVVAINKCHDDLVLKAKNSDTNHYINEIIPDEDEEDGIYEVLNPAINMKPRVESLEVKPPLPLGRPGCTKPKQSIKVAPPIVMLKFPDKNIKKPAPPSYQSSDGCQGSYHQFAPENSKNSRNNSIQSSDSFSDGSEDLVYQSYVPVNKAIENEVEKKPPEAPSFGKKVLKSKSKQEVSPPSLFPKPKLTEETTPRKIPPAPPKRDNSK